MSQRGFGNYDLRPVVTVSGEHRAFVGDDALRELAGPAEPRLRVAVDAYPGVDVALLAHQAAGVLSGWRVVVMEDCAKPSDVIDALIAPNLTDDRVFGIMGHHRLGEFYDDDKLAVLASEIDAEPGPVLVIGWGAVLVPIHFDAVVWADLPRWEIQQRYRAGLGNWRCDNGGEDILRKYKRGFFVEWRAADRHKRAHLIEQADHVLDTTRPETPVLVSADAVRAGLEQAAHRPFRVVPYFDPGTWGGQWMREVMGLPDDAPNYAWCFDCVPEENSLVLQIGGVEVELAAINLVFRHPEELLGPRVRARFGEEFPIRFDLLDTMEGGNLSLQVHPLTGYIQDRFGMHYTQDESYYLLDAADDAVVYLGVRDDADPETIIRELRDAEGGGVEFGAEHFVNTFPAHTHDHFAIPAGTVHCSGANSMVLEVSATPYIFTFKMWDWGRLGLDGVPRPVHLDHAQENIQWNRRRDWVTDNLVGQTQPTGEGEGWREERTGLHELEFIETRRRWISGAAPDDTRGTLRVVHLVAGAEAIVESPTGAFEPFVVHYAETFIIPAAVGAYVVRPHGQAEGGQVATLTAHVRGTETY